MGMAGGRRALTLIASLLMASLAGAAAGQRTETGALQARYLDERARAASLRHDAREAASELEQLRLELARLGASSGDAALADQRARLSRLSAEEAELMVALSLERGRLMRVLSSLQQLTLDPVPVLVAPSHTTIETARAVVLMQAMVPELKQRHGVLSERHQALLRTRRHVALNSEQLFLSESTRVDRRGRLEALISETTALEAVLEAEITRVERQAEALAGQLRARNMAVPALRQGEAERVSRNALPGGRRHLSAPVRGEVIARYGGTGSGWRWRSEGAAEVTAPADGIIDHAGPLRGWGEVVIVRLGAGWRIVLTGLAASEVRAGQSVREGERLGVMAGDGGELYLELRREDTTVDPSRWLEARAER